MLLALALLLCSFISFNGVLAGETSSPATKDSTIIRSTAGCPSCPDSNCYKCTLGHEKTLESGFTQDAFINALVGFKLPVSSSSVTRCTVQFPAFTQPLQSPVTITITKAASSNWDEDTVTAENAPDFESPFTMVTVPPNTNMDPIDITQACKEAASDGQFSIYLGNQPGEIKIWSKDSGNPAILNITFT
ncbi:hypothetical protein GGI12_001960 [Dipsacomyces acuminosporus]|nr:hypothetical protein GGI12_001960 [Dipsacomyces acuminosporus]